MIGDRQSWPKVFVSAFVAGLAFVVIHLLDRRYHFGTQIPACVALVSTTSGLGSQVLHLLHTTVHSREIYWDFSNSAYGCGDTPSKRWSSMFATKIQHTNMSAAPPSCAHYDVGEITGMNRLAVRRHPFTAKRRLCRALGDIWRPSALMAARASAVAHMFRSAAQPVVVLQARGGDKVHGAETETVPYLELIRPRLMDVANRGFINGTCFIVGDDYEIARHISNQVGSVLACHVHNFVKENYSHSQHSFNTETDIFHCESTKAVFADIEALTLANATVGLARSNLYRVALIRRACAGIFKSNQNSFDWQGRDMITDIMLDE